MIKYSNTKQESISKVSLPMEILKSNRENIFPKFPYLQLWTLLAEGEPFPPMSTQSSTEQVGMPWGLLQWGPLCSTALLVMRNLSCKQSHGNVKVFFIYAILFSRYILCMRTFLNIKMMDVIYKKASTNNIKWSRIHYGIHKKKLQILHYPFTNTITPYNTNLTCSLQSQQRVLPQLPQSSPAAGILHPLWSASSQRRLHQHHQLRHPTRHGEWCLGHSFERKRQHT